MPEPSIAPKALARISRFDVVDRELTAVPEPERWLAEEALRLRLGPFREASFLAATPTGLSRVWVTRASGNTISVTHARTPAPFGLTLRQLEVLAGVACGMTNPVIARHLHLSVKTVAKHVEHLLVNLGCASRVDLAVLAVRRKLVFLPRPAADRAFTDEVRTRLIDTAEQDALAAPAQRRPITCVAVYPWNDSAGNALAMKNGTQLAFDRFNLAGGVGDRPLQFQWIETADARHGVEQALAAGADAILLGNFPFPDSLAAIEAARGTGVPVLHCMITPQLSEAVLSDDGFDNVFQVCGVETAYSRWFGQTLAAALAQRGRRHGSASLVLRPHMLRPESIAAIEEALHSSGIEIAALVSSEELEADPRAASRLLADDPDAVHFSVLPEPLLRSVLPFARSDRALIFADWSPSSPAFLDRAGADAEGLFWSTIVGAGTGAAYRGFRDGYAAKFGADPGMSVAAVHFDIVHLLAHAWRATERPWDFAAVRGALGREVFRGLAGPYWLGGPGQRGLVHSVDTPDASLALPVRSYRVQGGRHRPLRTGAA